MLKAIRNLDYVVLLCDNLPIMRHFYHTIMGFPIHLETDSWIEMRVGSVLLTLSTRKRPFIESAPSNRSTAIQLAFRVTPQEVGGCYEELKANHVEIVQAPQIIDKRVWHYSVPYTHLHPDVATRRTCHETGSRRGARYPSDITKRRACQGHGSRPARRASHWGASGVDAPVRELGPNIPV